ncbi:MAG: sulfur carrier protein ThiS [Lachnospiraceae bacterium]|nr:sulfur carrier protein ThiS [Lachnospiraceae bacterium]MBQ2576593.1 sulfur carrier protein ThiS [Lachnospiraceae bacterium]MBQ5485076.1 sulfur carrier protein ThiS [Lachnospiraceae bacterium]MCR4733091.1 sulfur carrier protein ThiS [Lachnospiraceae bacterium]
MVTINGEELDLAGKTLASYLQESGHDAAGVARIAVERNGEIVFRSTYNDVVLEDGDKVEIVTFMGGG